MKRLSLYEAFRGKCFYCEEECALEDATRDHWRPRSKGYTLRQGNVVLACRWCNEAKEDFDPLSVGLPAPFATSPAQQKQLEAFKQAIKRMRVGKPAQSVARRLH